MDFSAVYGRKAILKHSQPSDSALDSPKRLKDVEVSTDAALSLGQGLNFKHLTTNSERTLLSSGLE